MRQHKTAGMLSGKPLSEIDIPEWLRKLPKVELHLHLEGTIEPQTLVALSRRHDADPLTLDAARKLYTYENFLGFLDSYKAVSRAPARRPDDYELITYNMLRSRWLRRAWPTPRSTSPSAKAILYFWRKVEVEPAVEAIERGRIRGETDFGTTVYWLIDAVRNLRPCEEAAARLPQGRPSCARGYPSIVGIGIGGDEARGLPRSSRRTTPRPATPACA